MTTNNLKDNIIRFKRKFHVNQLIRGSLISILLFGAIWLIFSLLEGYFWFDQPVRLGIFAILVGLLLYFVIFRILIPISKIVQINRGISDQEAAKLIGRHFPDIQDKLLNLLQLSQNSTSQSSLLLAAIDQKQSELKVFDFKEAVDFKVNKKYLIYVGSLLVVIFLVSFISPGLFSESSSRIVQFNKPFEKPAPFSFELESKLFAFKGDSYEIDVMLNGESIPDQVYLLDNNQKFRLNKGKNGHYVFNYPSINSNKSIQFSAAGYDSKKYEIKVINRPELRNMSVKIDYPEYTGLSDEMRENTGSFVVAEGTKITWNINSSDTQQGFFIVGGDSSSMSLKNDHFEFARSVTNSLEYEIALANEYATNKSRIIYDISVIKDELPEIDANYLPDTISYKSLLFTGNIEDDYGFTSLSLLYKKNDDKNYHRIAIPFEKSQINQQFYLQWDLDSMNLTSEDYLEAFVQVTDNDRINGYKASQSQKFFLRMPSDKEVESMISEKSNESESKLDDAEAKAEEINDRLKDLEDRLRNKRELDWQDKKLIEDIIKDKEKLSKEIEELAEQHQQLLDSQKEFGKQSEKLQEKAKQLQELIEEVLDDETKKLYDELQKLLKEQNNTDQVLEELSKIKNNEKNMEKELERALELFKRLKLQTGIEQSAEKLEKLAEKQEDLANVTMAEALLDEERQSSKSAENKESQQQNDEQKAAQTDTEKQQEEINKEFDEIQEQLDSLEQLNQDLKNPQPMEDFQKEEQQIEEKLNEIPQDLQNQQKQKAGQKMKNAGQQMKNMASSMQQMQMGMEMTMMQENLDHLRDILDNLIKLSFEQENIIDEIKEVQQIDPRFIELSQDQLQLISNAQVIEDSLLSLASRVAQISNFVTREVGEINSQLDRAMNELRERNKGKAASHQQFAMTSMNNLALLLDDVMQQMQMAMSEAMGNPQKGQGQKQSLPSMQQMQQQLSDQIQQLKSSGKSGRELSEQLAKLAAEQAELRRQMESMQQQLAGQKAGKEGENGEEGGNGSEAGDKLGEAIKQMEENEVDLVNKRLTQELIDRQQEILTRMLEAEESMREQKESPEREGETATPQQRKLPPAIEEYLKAKKEEIELLKTIPLDLNPFYKKEVNDYFRRLSGEEQ
ncbi:DUF4175 family protein [Marinoscillum pacificum]|uniref:DUF4175 family protein n=1 Tax=Marinoscillum pacificum TaxID=392723 RepID=UPI002157034C|nr:DUF4175 family protein [Marinoscillum pacificum]